MPIEKIDTASATQGTPQRCIGEHRTIRLGAVLFNLPEGFNFGRGATSMDRFVASVTPGSGHGYAEQWKAADWAVAFECSLQLEDLGGRLCTCAPVPDWLPSVVNGHLHFSYDLPYPTIGMLDDPTVDWFALHDAHPEQWNLYLPWDEAPTLDTVRAGLELARSLGGIAGLWVDIAPHRDDAVLTTLAGMNVVWPSASDAAKHEETISALYTESSTYIGGRTPQMPQNERLWLWC